jgi:CreA protein
MTATAPTLEALALGFIPEVTLSLSVSDYRASMKWYQETLGFQFRYEMPEIGWTELSTTIPGLSLGLSQVERVEPNGGLVPTFGVKDIAHARSQLEARGVRFDGETQIIPGEVKLATFYDPDGNPLMLFEAIPTPA